VVGDVLYISQNITASAAVSFSGPGGEFTAGVSAEAAILVFGAPAPSIVVDRATFTRPHTATVDQRSASMKAYLGPRHAFVVTSIIKPGEHSKYEKMDVAPRAGTRWEQLALAAIQAGFWVRAEGVHLAGVYWKPSGKATGPHLDVYNLVPARMGVPDTQTPSDWRQLGGSRHPNSE
jgi:hypothetical protein